MLVLLLACSEYEFIGDADVDPTPDEERPEEEEPVEDTAPPLPDEDCLDFLPPLPIGGGVDETCLAEVEEGSFDPTVEWQWNTNAIASGYHQVMASPAVGDVTGDGLPDVVFTAFTGSSYGSAGQLIAVSGDGSGMHWSIGGLGGHGIYGASQVAIGDLEGDGLPEICVSGTSSAVLCGTAGTDGVPTLRFAAGSETYAYGAPAIADLDGDGLAEVIFGRQIFDADGNTLAVGSSGTGSYMSFAVDWDDDGELEVVVGNAVYEADGSLLMSTGGSDGIPATADFDGDGAPDLVVVTGGKAYLYGNDGAKRWEQSLPGGGNGGPPTVADFDGDGAPEVGVAGLGRYTLFDTDGTQLWSNDTEDDSSSKTGSAVFDFEGDGTAEVIYADEHNLFIYDGATGSVRLQESGHASGTLYEYPLVADVDADGATEIVLASNNYTISGWNGITVIGDASDSWAPARELWNQFAYHITNVASDLSIPAVQTANWDSWNSFRAGGTELGPGHWLADLDADFGDVCLLECGQGTVTLYVQVVNTGLVEASASVQLVGFGGDVLAEEDVGLVPSGEGAVAGPFVIDELDWGPELQVVVDPDELVDECDEDNTVDLGPWPCPA